MNWVAVLGGQVEINIIQRMPEQMYRRKGTIVCPGKVTADVSSALWEITVKESASNSVSGTSWAFLPHLPQNI